MTSSMMSDTTLSAGQTESVREHLADWLRDAHALEGQAVTLCETQADRLKNYPELEARLREHAQESKVQRSRIESCLERLGTDASVVKDSMTKVLANVVALSHAAMSDEVVKNGVADYAFEHFEIATYKTLIATAQIAGEAQIVAALQQNLREEEQMAEWIEQQQPLVLKRFLALSAEGEQAKR